MNRYLESHLSSGFWGLGFGAGFALIRGSIQRHNTMQSERERESAVESSEGRRRRTRKGENEKKGFVLY